MNSLPAFSSFLQQLFVCFILSGKVNFTEGEARGANVTKAAFPTLLMYHYYYCHSKANE